MVIWSTLHLEPLIKAAPEGVQHEFGDGFPTWDLVDVGRLQLDTFANQALLHILIKDDLAFEVTSRLP